MFPPAIAQMNKLTINLVLCRKRCLKKFTSPKYAARPSNVKSPINNLIWCRLAYIFIKVYFWHVFKRLFICSKIFQSYCTASLLPLWLLVLQLLKIRQKSRSSARFWLWTSFRVLALCSLESPRSELTLPLCAPSPSFLFHFRFSLFCKKNCLISINSRLSLIRTSTSPILHPYIYLYFQVENFNSKGSTAFWLCLYLPFVLPFDCVILFDRVAIKAKELSFFILSLNSYH